MIITEDFGSLIDRIKKMANLIDGDLPTSLFRSYSTPSGDFVAIFYENHMYAVTGNSNPRQLDCYLREAYGQLQPPFRETFHGVFTPQELFSLIITGFLYVGVHDKMADMIIFREFVSGNFLLGRRVNVSRINRVLEKCGFDKIAPL